MIKRIFDLDSINLSLSGSHYSGIILSQILTYGADYDFCELYSVSNRKRIIGIISFFNGTLTADLFDGKKPSRGTVREINEFIEFKSPRAVELPPSLVQSGALTNYRRVKRIFAEIETPAKFSTEITSPPLENVYRIVYGRECDPNGEYGMWLTDILRRISKGISEVYGYCGAVVTVRYKCFGRSYLDNLATPPELRGNGYASALLRAVTYKLSEEGYVGYVSYEEQLSEFYSRLGFKETGFDYILLQDIKDEDDDK